MIKQFVIELYEYRFTWEVKIKGNEDEEEIPIMLKDEDQNSLDEKPEEKMEDVSKVLVSYQIVEKEEIEMIVV